MSEKLKDEAEQKEQLRRLKNEMENERWHLDKTIEKLLKEVREQERRGRGCGNPACHPQGPAEETCTMSQHRCVRDLQIS